MRADQASVWYRRMSVVYAVGAWSVVGSVYLFTRKQKVSGHGVGQEDGSRNETPVSTSQDPHFITEIAKPVSGLYVETVVKRSENVPVTQRILDYLNSWTGGPGAES
ncbi:small integral membrane protein 26 [Meriones unguiculatus]|uniref:small integral membrane protein 26 n=1 Tax=Meriones unguiculatus TaxID=10047 RepID=UPI001088B307|nr:small integral membrane protein 26 [Meriones unguiculatus]